MSHASIAIVPAAAEPTQGNVDLTAVDRAIAQFGTKPEALIPILQALQDHYGYLPQEALLRLCEKTQIKPAAITGVASFYDIFRHRPVGKYMIRLCRGTACHVSGADRVDEALRRELHIHPGDDTDPTKQFTIEAVACLGCCTLAPVVRISQTTFGHVAPEKVPQIIHEFLANVSASGELEKSTEKPTEKRPHMAEIRVGLGSCCMAKGSGQLYHALEETVRRNGLPVIVKRVGCVGMCHRTPLVEITGASKKNTVYAGLTPALAPDALQRHFKPRGLIPSIARAWTNMANAILADRVPSDQIDACALNRADREVSAFLDRQVHIATEHFGTLDPLDLDEYLEHDGFVALAKCLGVPAPIRTSPGKTSNIARKETENPKTDSQNTTGHPRLAPEQIISQIVQSGLRGRGGAGFPTGQKWRAVRDQKADKKYVICNGDEGDPGAFMDRMLLESFPFRIIEGIAIAAIAVGAHEGVFYIRHEYPLAVRRVRAALSELERRGWLGKKLLGSDYELRLSVMEGAGAFVCGEETALIASIEGRRGMPRLRPPYPAESGLFNCPTLINNVETLAVVPWILRNGPDAFAKIGTKTSKGTKVFALAGRVKRGGLIEVPMGTTIREIVEEMGGGAADGRRFKAVQIGGPSGGCVPARLADTPIDYESLQQVGAIMGSGGLVVLDDSTCMVDIARYFLRFTQEQSCGKCTFCRIGTRRMLEILDRICEGKGRTADLDELEHLARRVSQSSLCGLGKTAPNPVLSTLRYFRDEYEAHINGRCPAKKCVPLIHYVINDRCTGCTLCAQHCPVDAIPMTPYQRHKIDDAKCTRCDSCRQVCPYSAIDVL